MQEIGELSVAEAQTLLEGLADVFLHAGPDDSSSQLPAETRYRTLLEQIAAVVFMVYLDQGIGEAYVSPHIEATLGFTQAEWLEDPVRWYRQLHPDDNMRWSLEAAEMFLTGKPLRSVYRVIARDGHVVWFQCEAKVVRRENGQPWFIHGVAFDVTELKRAEEALQEQSDFVSTILDAVDTFILVLDPQGRVVHVNRACEKATGRTTAQVRGSFAWDVFAVTDQRARFAAAFEYLIHSGSLPTHFETQWIVSGGEARSLSWSGRTLPGPRGGVRQVIVTATDVTESKRLQQAIVDISAREQRRIAQDLHDGLGQLLTGIGFMSKVLVERLAPKSPNDAAQAAKVVSLVTEALHTTRELARGLLPVAPDSEGLRSALDHWSTEVERLYGITCHFSGDAQVRIHDENMATHLYRIAQEAVNNAVKHGHASRIEVSLLSSGNEISLSVADNGIGLPGDAAVSRGMGLHIMQYRAKMIGGTLQVRRRPEGGTMVTCQVQTYVEDAGHDKH